ncbi:MAG: hypothetical protein U9O59_08100 [Actinomycetota bacterium]|nr:hypothetical protein [Actinomycetota bacterium]
MQYRSSEPAIIFIKIKNSIAANRMIHEAVATLIAIKAKRLEKYNGYLEYLYTPLVTGLSIGVVMDESTEKKLHNR